MFLCTICNSSTKVLETRGRHRTRECESCGVRMRTVERAYSPPRRYTLPMLRRLLAQYGSAKELRKGDVNAYRAALKYGVLKSQRAPREQ